MSCLSIATVRSSPVMVSRLWPGSLAPVISWRVIRPSISTLGRLFMVATRITRSHGTWPPATSSSVCSGERLSITKLIWKPLGVSADDVTSTLSRASIKGFGAGIGTPGPTSKVRWMPLSIAASALEADAAAEAGGQGQAQGVAGAFEGARHLGAIAVGDAPVLDRVAEMGRRQAVEAAAVRDLDFADGDQGGRVGHEAAAQVDDLFAIRAGQFGGRHAGVAAVGREAFDAHGSPLRPSAARLPRPASAAWRSLRC